MRALVVHAHPSPESFSHAVLAAVVRGLTTGGHEPDVIDLYADGFGAAMSEEERQAYSGANPVVSEHVADYVERLKAAQAIVFVYPTWWWGMPAAMKGWLDRVMLPGVAFTLGERRPKPALRHVRRLIGVSTYGSSRTEMRLLHDAGRRTVARTVRTLTNRRTRTTWLGMYRCDQTTDTERRQFLSDVETRLARL